ncbi:hypothetical protein [Nonomuraea sediminis]|uniref:hypothetical protein n=1 Tax=Nonomuraea sediminis TaxID=2835864 RepID=UPI001BDCC79E|nr:hypothetical protein [Nonomuraea sediminis]
MISAPKLRDDLELLTGMDDRPLVYDPITGTYHRVTPAARVVLGHLDGTRTREELVALLGGGEPGRLEAFLATLEESGLLVGSDPPEKPRRGRINTSLFMPRVVISRALPRLLEPLAAMLRRRNPRVLVALFALGGLAGYPLAVVRTSTEGLSFPQIAGPAFVLAAVLQLALMFVHETAHALVAQVLRVPVRGLGVALLFYFMPLAYVDRTDAYRLRGRGGRIVLSLAGVMSDGWFTLVTATVAFTTSGLPHHTASIMLVFQLLGLVINLNPLLPSDGYTAIEAATGLVDPRGRAFTLLGSKIIPRPLPEYLTNLPARARLAYLAYASISAAYICVLAVSVVSALPWVVRAALAAVGP